MILTHKSSYLHAIEDAIITACDRSADLAPAKPAPAAQSPISTEKPLRVLVMDDEPLMLTALSMMLTHLGHTVTGASSGEETVRLYGEAAPNNCFDLVCIDIMNRHGIDGLETMHRLQLLNPDVAALVTSGYSNHSVMSEYRSFGFIGTMPKPASLKQLKDCLRQAIQSLKPSPV